VVVLAARLLWHKGVREFVEAARLLRREGHDARFVLVGARDGGNPAAVSPEVVDEWVAAGVVEHWGHREDMERVFASCHVVCLPSYREGLPKVLIEAAAAGRPIVASDEPGCREVVEPGVTGVVVPVGDAAALADAIRPLLTDAALRRRFGVAARERAEQSFGVEQVIAQTLALYAELQG
jgi:glycosyltransferase involved in cell wall biosynthesis